jgi:hypothetical protein
MVKRMREFLNNKWGCIQSFFKDRPDQYEREFIDHNRKIWRNYRSDRSQGEILIEANNMCGCNVAMSYLGSYLGNMEKSKLIVFAKGLSRSHKPLYGSFADSFLLYSPDPCKEEVETVFSQVFPQIRSKRELEDLRVDGIWIGDLIYDTYIRKLDVITVDISTRGFADVLREALGYLIHWRKYFAGHRVKAVLVGHCVYSWAGIITRVAVSHSVPVYLIQPGLLYYVTQSHNARPYNDGIDYPLHFEQLSPEEQSKALCKAKDRIELRFLGERDVGSYHLLKPTYTAKTGQRVLTVSSRIKVMVASHCFSDDNHIYGNNLFSDFYEWLCFLGNISERTDYDWYIKLHPDRYPWETQHIEEFAQRFTRFRLLQADVSHHQIIEDGINCVLTVYGTIGFEYAALGVPVITASVWNPTVAYDFNVHPKTVEEYERMLMNLSDLHIKIDINKVYEYYFCQYMDNAYDWLYDNCESVFEEIIARQKIHESIAYRKFLDQFSEKKHTRILKTVDRFVQSKDYRLRSKHIVSD